MSDTDASRERELIAVGRTIDWDAEGELGTVRFGPGPAEFPPLIPETIRRLVDRGHLDPDQAQNDGPTVRSVLSFLDGVASRYDDRRVGVGATGYLVAPDRPDSRIAIDGIVVETGDPMPDSLQREVAHWARSADFFSVDRREIRARWD